jgi:hypothetical protein
MSAGAAPFIENVRIEASSIAVISRECSVVILVGGRVMELDVVEMRTVDKPQERPEAERGVVYEVRALTNRWEEPQSGPVVSSHSTAKAAWEAFTREPQAGADGSGRTAGGNYVAKAVVRVGADGAESMVLPPPAGGGLLSWPYN